MFFFLIRVYVWKNKFVKGLVRTKAAHRDQLSHRLFTKHAQYYNTNKLGIFNVHSGAAVTDGFWHRTYYRCLRIRWYTLNNFYLLLQVTSKNPSR